jgi:hypothetical protein
VPISYDDKHIWVRRADAKPDRQSVWAHLKAIAMWVSRGDGKQVKLTQSSLRDIFTGNQQCRGTGAPKTN